QPTIYLPSDAMSSVYTLGGVQVVQVSDRAGHTLLRSDGSLNTNPATRLSRAATIIPLEARRGTPPIIALAGGGPYTLTLRGTGGAYQETIVNPDFAVRVRNGAATRKVKDVLTLDSRARSMQFRAGSTHKPLTFEVYARAP